MKHSVLAIMLVLAMTITPFTEGKADTNITGKEIEVVDCYRVEEMSDNVGRVKQDDKYGYVNKEGKEVVKCQYDEVTICSDGMVMGERDGKWYVISIE